MLQRVADDALPISMLMALAVIKALLSSAFFIVGMSRLAYVLALLACMEAGCPDGRARDSWLHGYVSALVCSYLTEIRRP